MASAKGANNPTDPGSWNHYAYTGGDPINRKDPTGLLWVEICSFGDGSTDPSCGSGGVTDPLCGNLLNGDPEPGCYWGLPEQNAPSKAPPSCESGLNQRDISFVSNNFFAALSVSVSNGNVLSADFILAWGANESGFGTSNASINNDNFFGETNPSGNPNKTAPWQGAVPCAQVGAKASPGYACFSGSTLAASALAALAGRHGLYLTVASFFQGFSVATVAQAIADAGWCTDSLCNNGQYGAVVQKDYNELVPVINCLFPWEQATLSQ
jgi:hypothetical protein